MRDPDGPRGPEAGCSDAADGPGVPPRTRAGLYHSASLSGNTFASRWRPARFADRYTWARGQGHGRDGRRFGPACEPAVAGATPERMQNRTFKNARILIVDDEAPNVA